MNDYVMNDLDYVFKIITAGQGGVGKTTMLHRYIEGVFLYDTKMTIGVEIFDKVIKHNGKNISLQLWDFGGQERFRFFLDSFVLGSSGAFLMFDLTSYNSFEGLEEWVNIVRKEDSTLPIVLLGSKFDILEDLGLDSINESEIIEFMEKHNIRSFLKVSAKTDKNIDYAFGNLMEEVIESKCLNTNEVAKIIEKN